VAAPLASRAARDRARRPRSRASTADGGGLRDALALVVASVVAFRLPELVHAVLNVAGPTSGAFMRLVALFAARRATRPGSCCRRRSS
jgi:hypothetical protein